MDYPQMKNGEGDAMPRRRESYTLDVRKTGSDVKRITGRRYGGSPATET